MTYILGDGAKSVQQGIPNSSLSVHTRGHGLTWVAAGGELCQGTALDWEAGLGSSPCGEEDGAQGGAGASARAVVVGQERRAGDQTQHQPPPRF